jgi:arylamine N-acetyltransferase
MSGDRIDERTQIAVNAVEALMLEKFRTEPFHNLGLLYGEHLRAVVPGGTCSDKTLSFLSAAGRAGFDVALHSARIGGQEVHRLARVHIAGRVFFADVGNGWPALRLYPADREVAVRCFGMRFRTEIGGEHLRVFHERKGRESLQLELDVRGRPERDVRADIERRFSSGIVYPFSDSLRFALVIGERFLFLRGDRLEMYGEDAHEEVERIGPADVMSVLHHRFGYDLRAVLGPTSAGEKG